MASITLQSVSVDFPLLSSNARSFKKNFLHLTTGGAFLKKTNDNKTAVVRALDKVSVQLNHGDRVALIGHNGSGKSTLLRVLAKIYEPTSGAIFTEGKISPLLDLLLGTNPESTGYENIMLRGLLLGLTREEISAKMSEIAEFTELGDYLAMPVRTYSTGMQLRLAFGVATSINPEILLLDEVVGTGDASFVAKAQKRLDKLVEESSIVVLASHAEEMVRKICNKAIMLSAGKIIYFGDVSTALEIYQNKKTPTSIETVV